MPGHAYSASTVYGNPLSGLPVRSFTWTFQITPDARNIIGRVTHGDPGPKPITKPTAACLTFSAPAARALPDAAQGRDSQAQGMPYHQRPDRVGRGRLRAHRTVKLHSDRTSRVKLKVTARLKAGTATLSVTAGQDKARRRLRVRA